ncbi:uncharacterized protein RAG0_06716 [Rhynchosporium agropyri]|uniref:Uncharacterized protein n=1 Tax=Rhynchosporium agropyri TaxID=914238 RepID=A0A1E1KIL3_9HELO|nr:uncharacterized protein RAG0_06716 [Rhynchosporium agropyri]
MAHKLTISPLSRALTITTLFSFHVLLLAILSISILAHHPLPSTGESISDIQTRPSTILKIDLPTSPEATYFRHAHNVRFDSCEMLGGEMMERVKGLVEEEVEGEDGMAGAAVGGIGGVREIGGLMGGEEEVCNETEIRIAGCGEVA